MTAGGGCRATSQLRAADESTTGLNSRSHPDGSRPLVTVGIISWSPMGIPPPASLPRGIERVHAGHGAPLPMVDAMV